MHVKIPLLAGVLACSTVAQTTATLPDPGTLPSTTANNLPIAGGPARYQQWFSAAEMQNAFSEPGRISSLTLQPGPGAVTTTTIDVEVTLSHGPAFGPFGFFDANLDSSALTVFPRSNVTVTAGSPLIFNFTQTFTWDGSSPLLVEIRVFGNGFGGQPFPHDNVSTATATGRTTRLYSLSGPNATSATSVQPGWGLLMDITMLQGAVVDFGQGCPGAGGFVPVGETGSVPVPGQVWRNEVRQANNGRLAFLTLGDDRTTINGMALPLDLGTFGGAGCDLYNNALHTFTAVTVGGGPGSSRAIVDLNVLPISPLVGTHWYSQWFIFDDQAPNGLIAASEAHWVIVSP